MLRRRTGMIIGIVAAILAVVVVISLVVRIDKLETTTSVGTFMTYEVGKLDDTTGKGMTSAARETFEENGGLYKGAMHLKQYINADGLKCEVAENATIRYKVYLFDDHYVLKTSTDWMTVDFDITETDITGVKFAMIEISPTADPDGVISWLEVSDYAKQLTVTYNK